MLKRELHLENSRLIGGNEANLVTLASFAQCGMTEVGPELDVNFNPISLKQTRANMKRVVALYT